MVNAFLSTWENWLVILFAWYVVQLVIFNRKFESRKEIISKHARYRYQTVNLHKDLHGFTQGDPWWKGELKALRMTHAHFVWYQRGGLVWDQSEFADNVFNQEVNICLTQKRSENRFRSSAVSHIHLWRNNGQHKMNCSFRPTAQDYHAQRGSTRHERIARTKILYYHTTNVTNYLQYTDANKPEFPALTHPVAWTGNITLNFNVQCNEVHLWEILE
jgi:predicted membrane protein